MQLNVFNSLLWLFDAIWIYSKNQNFKNEEMRTALIFSWTGGPSFMRSRIIIPVLS